MIVDDDQNSIEILSDFISLVPELNLKQTFLAPIEAYNYLIQERDIDLLFLDIEMPSMNGLVFFEKVVGIVDKIIFTTAHLSYLIETYDYSNNGFLHKPFTFKKFTETITFTLASIQFNKYKINQQKRIILRTKGSRDHFVKLDLNDIILIESIKNYLTITLNHGTITARMTLKDFEEHLNSMSVTIVKVHRSFLISLDKIKDIKNKLITMVDGSKVPLSTMYKNNLFKEVRNNLFIHYPKVVNVKHLSSETFIHQSD